MKTHISFLLLFLSTCILLMSGCANSGSKENNQDQFKWLIGSRADTTLGIFENWASTGDSCLSGNGFQVTDGNTIFKESLSVKRIGNNWAYIVRYGTEETHFTLANEPGDSLVFENPDNEFPKRITYIKKVDGAIIAIIENPGEPDKTIRFNFIPIK